ncbi:protein kinase [Kamptonema cortianum]|nr:protein kinase [Kamptonema cortianum]
MSEQILNGRYRLVAQQGSGGMAVIYRADDLALGRTVAIKILRPNLTSDPAFIARFRNEARSIANLMHPNIVTVHDVGNDGATHYIVMEFVEGLDLKKVIKSEGALTIERALRVAIQICAGIGFAHRAGIVHADVKPQNILITRDDTVKVTDFGIAQAFTDAQPGERQQVVWGSPHYFAPEQARGEKPTPASDVYSIGIVLFELLSGRLPYQGTDQQALALAHIRERIPMVNEFNPNVSDSLARIVFKTMSKEPSQRYRMADQLGSILSTYLEKGLDGGAQSAAVSPASQPGAGAVIPPPPQRMTTQQSPAAIPPAPPLPPGAGRLAAGCAASAC